MKATKILLAVSVACLLATANVLAQGRINFNNTSTTPLSISHPSINGGVPVVLGTASTALFGIGPASVRIQLYAGLTSSSMSPVLIGTGANQVYATNSSSFIPGTQGTFVGGGDLALPGFDGSVPAFLQFTAVSIDGLWGNVSPIIQFTPTLSPGFPPLLFSPTADASHWDGLTIYPIPEPSALALVGMSLPLMFLARRRK